MHGRWRFFLTHLQKTSYDFFPFSQRNTTTVFRQHVLYFSSIRQGCSYQNFNWSKSLSLFAKCLLYMNLLLGLYVRFREKTFHHLKCTFCLHCFLWAPVHEDVPHRRHPVRCHLVLSLKALGVGKKVSSFFSETLRGVDTLKFGCSVKHFMALNCHQHPVCNHIHAVHTLPHQVYYHFYWVIFFFNLHQ